ncbi:porin family protein [Bizionia saleffrena]|uniref:Porin family protein n=1 Tax=Bizionia saleffrena TaxID=291189 RepID=A0A8H2LJK1_9FLAO|nr:outer membrane beta-barrel protein [Bizionia saleffrena]TYB80301.1 porin family protein [Bizionia saleffrena]
MKQKIVLLAVLFMSTMSYAQFEISASTGYAMGSAGMKLGETVTASERENSYGSYGEGANVQIRGTYFFNDSFGADIALGYLHGTDQTISEVNVPGQQVDAVARARAFGASASIVYKFTNNLYGRFGALIKVGGKTEAVVNQRSTFSPAEANAQGLPEGSYSETDYVEDFHGQFPLGFVGALGYKFDLGNNFGLFVEAEYYGISLKRKDSEITEFNTDIKLPDGTVAQSGFYSLDNLPAGYVKKTTYVDELSNDNTDPSKKLAEKVPYSSFGINFGVTYKFNSATK